MAKQKKGGKLNIPMCVALVLFCMTMLSVYLTSGLYARYVTSAHGEDSARVIGFGTLTLTETGDFAESGTAIVAPGIVLQKKAVVDFSGSEAATYIFVEVELSADWTYDEAARKFTSKIDGITMMEWEIDTVWTYLKKTKTNTYVFFKELNPNVDFHADIVKNNGQLNVGEEITEEKINLINTIYIKFRATAVQSNGFAAPASAWDAVAI